MYKVREANFSSQKSKDGKKLMCDCKCHEEKCKHCGGDIHIRYPVRGSGCDHLYYPENCEVCAEESTLLRRKTMRLQEKKAHLLGIKKNLEEVRNKMWSDPDLRSDLFPLLIAVEQMWIIEKRRLNKELASVGIVQIKR